MNNRPSSEDAAREILRIAVRDLNVKANTMIAAQPEVDRFNNLPWRQADLRPGLMLAQAKGWITEDGRLTEAGFAAAYV